MIEEQIGKRGKVIAVWIFVLACDKWKGILVPVLQLGTGIYLAFRKANFKKANF